jgi:AraC family transcriptional regulator
MPSQWNKFVPHLGQIQGQAGAFAYGVIYNCDEAGSCDYMCGVEVKEFPSHPAGFTRLRIPPQTYAVFEHRDHISAIGATWKAIWEHGLADAGYQAADGPAFERYGEQFDGATGLGGLELWVPVTPKK